MPPKWQNAGREEKQGTAMRTAAVGPSCRAVTLATRTQRCRASAVAQYGRRQTAQKVQRMVETKYPNKPL